MPASTSLGGVKTRPHRGTLSAAFALLPILIVVLLMLPEPVALAGSSILEIEPPSEADSHHPSATPSEKILSRDSNKHCDGDKADDSDDAAGDADKTTQASKDEQSNDADDSDDSDDADDTDDAKPVAASKTKQQATKPQDAKESQDAAESNDSDCAEKDADSADSNDSDDDTDDDAEVASKYENRPSLETRIDHATDSEHNDTVTTSTIANALVNDYFVSLRRDSVAAHDQIGSERFESTVISIHKDLSETFGLGGGFGMVRTDGWSGFVGSFQAHGKLLGTEITASIARDFIASEADAIRARIAQTDFGLSASYELSKRISSDFEFHHKLYSDHNSSNEFEWTPKYTFDIRKTKLEVGYKFAYTAFARNTDHGYWAPQQVLSHNLFAAWAFDWVKTYGRVELSGGPDFVKESGPQSVGPSSGGLGVSAAVALGFRPTENMMVEFYLNGEQSPGWRSTNTGLSLKYFY
jgi:hypothetical protein